MVFFLTLFTRKANFFSYSINNPRLFYFTSAFFPPSLEGPEVLEMEQWWWRWSAPTRTTQVVTNKPSNTSWALESCVLPILSGLAACASLAKARHHFKCHTAEKSLSLSQERKERDSGEMPSYIWNPALSATWNLPPRLCLALAWSRQGCCVAQGGAETNMGTKPNTWLQEMFCKL